MQVLVRDNNVDQALKALKKKMQREGIFREMKLRGHYEKPSEKKAREKAEAVRRARKLARKKLQREGLLPMKPKPVFGAGPARSAVAPAVVAVPVRARAARADRRSLRDLSSMTRAWGSRCCLCARVFDRCILGRGRLTTRHSRASLPHLMAIPVPSSLSGTLRSGWRVSAAIAADRDRARRLLFRPGIVFVQSGKEEPAKPLRRESRWPQAQVYATHGQVLAKSGKTEEALAEFNRAIELDPNNAQALYGRGLLYQGDKQHQLAIDDFTAANGLKPQQAEPLLGPRGQLPRARQGQGSRRRSRRGGAGRSAERADLEHERAGL